MLDERTLDLINAGIDGELSPEESRQLDAILDSSAEARAMRAELLKLSNLLDSQPAVQPPADLSNRILHQIQPQTQKKEFSLASFIASFQPATAGAAFAAGLLATVAFYEISPSGGTGLDTSGMVGTMLADPDSVRTDQADSISFDGLGVTGKVTLQTANEVFALEFDFDSKTPVEVEIAFAEAGLGFGGIAHAVIGSDEAEKSYELSGGTLRVVNQGRQAFTVFLLGVASDGGDGRKIDVVVSSEGARVFAGTLRG
jgi:anti-sigma factor RsiW